MKGAGLLGDR